MNLYNAQSTFRVPGTICPATSKPAAGVTTTAVRFFPTILHANAVQLTGKSQLINRKFSIHHWELNSGYLATDCRHELTVNKHCALIIAPLFVTQAATCFGIHVPSSGSFLCPYELLESLKQFVVMYCKCWWAVCTGCCSFVCYVVQLRGTHRPPTFTVHDRQHNRFCLSSNSEGYRTLPEDGI
jgi:hypothetical protein